MRIVATIILAFVAADAALGSGASDTTAPDSPLAAFVASTSTLAAGFEQRIYNDGQLVEESNGTLVLSRPGRFRWEYQVPEQLIVADGARLWFYDIELDQVTVNDQDSDIAGSPAALLGGDPEALDGFRDAGRHSVDGIDWQVLEPRDEASDFERISIGFRDGGLVAMELSDSLDQLTRISFSDVTVNEPVDARAFEVAIPPGVDVIDRTAGAGHAPDD